MIPVLGFTQPFKYNGTEYFEKFHLVSTMAAYYRRDSAKFSEDNLFLDFLERLEKRRECWSRAHNELTPFQPVGKYDPRRRSETTLTPPFSNSTFFMITPSTTMAELENPAPELYLSLLSGGYSYKAKQLNNGRLSGPFRKDSEQWMSLLDALAAICVRKEKGDVFFVSLTMELNSATLYVSSNETVPPTLISHLHKIWAQLKKLQSVPEFDPSIPANSSDSSSTPNNGRTPSSSFRR